jgi:hypothetical protein
LVEIDNDADGFVLASLDIVVDNDWYTASHTEPWFISINGETITSVDSYENAINKNFYIYPQTSSLEPSSVPTAASIAKALRNCTTINSSFTVRNYGDTVELLARGKGKYVWSIQTNASSYVSLNRTNGTVSDELIGGKIEVDILDGSSNYITSLEKNYYESGCAFDITPALSTLVKPGKTVPYNIQVNATKNNGNYIQLGNITGNSITQGYMVNQGFKYIPLGSAQNDFLFAQNVSRGSSKSWVNNTNLYVYGNSIPVSWYSKTLDTVSVEVQYMTSSYSVITSNTLSLSDTSGGWLHNATVQLSQENKNSAYYIYLVFKNSYNIVIGGLMYNVIKPLKAAEYYQRVYWRNSYGGIAFFDFTCSKSESREVETTTYNKNVYDYYTQNVNEKAIPYDNAVKYSVTLKSHLIEKDGTYTFNDLIQSPEIWTEVNGETYRIILDSVSVDEDNRNDLYTATIKYKYSQSL